MQETGLVDPMPFPRQKDLLRLRQNLSHLGALDTPPLHLHLCMRGEVKRLNRLRVFPIHIPIIPYA